uniref:Uncharacterized protein n=1 Tax=Eutreptiella gymnastica TaxID=73025 RepID=A0A7S4G4M4_9EUGL
MCCSPARILCSTVWVSGLHPALQHTSTLTAHVCVCVPATHAGLGAQPRVSTSGGVNMEYIVTSRWALTLPVHGHQQAPKPHSVVFAAANVCFQCRSVPDVLPGWEKSAALQWEGSS